MALFFELDSLYLLLLLELRCFGLVIELDELIFDVLINN